jgi:hypothetical protein
MGGPRLRGPLFFAGSGGWSGGGLWLQTGEVFSSIRSLLRGFWRVTGVPIYRHRTGGSMKRELGLVMAVLAGSAAALA